MKQVHQPYMGLICLLFWLFISGGNVLQGQIRSYLVGGQLAAGFDWQDSATASLYHFSVQPNLGLQLGSSRWFAGITPGFMSYKDEQEFFDEKGWQASLNPWLRCYTGTDSMRFRVFGELGAGLLYAQQTLDFKPDQTADFFNDDNGILGQTSGTNFYALARVGANYGLGGGWFLEPMISGRVDRLLEGSRAPDRIDNFQLSIGLTYFWEPGTPKATP